MKTKLIELAKKVGFGAVLMQNVAYKAYPDLEPIRYYLWMCELQKWCREEYDKHTFIWYNTLTEQYRIESGNYIIKAHNPLKEFIKYEQALEEGLYQTLLLIQEGNEKEN